MVKEEELELERAKLGKSLGEREEIYRREWEGGVGARGNRREGDLAIDT